ncbi:unnamed protein product, partial [Meganyctiphanes norvegica]
SILYQKIFTEKKMGLLSSLSKLCLPFPHPSYLHTFIFLLLPSHPTPNPPPHSHTSPPFYHPPSTYIYGSTTIISVAAYVFDPCLSPLFFSKNTWPFVTYLQDIYPYF